MPDLTAPNAAMAPTVVIAPSPRFYDLPVFCGELTYRLLNEAFASASFGHDSPKFLRASWKTLKHFFAVCAVWRPDEFVLDSVTGMPVLPWPPFLGMQIERSLSLPDNVIVFDVARCPAIILVETPGGWTAKV